MKNFYQQFADACADYRQCATRFLDGWRQKLGLPAAQQCAAWQAAEAGKEEVYA